MRSLTLELIARCPAQTQAWWQRLWPGWRDKHRLLSQQFAAAQKLCLAGEHSAARQAFEQIDLPLARYFAEVLRGEVGIFNRREINAAALADRALKAVSRGRWLPARKAALKAKRLAFWRIDYQKYWYIIREVEQAAELRRLCHNTRVVIHALARRKYHRHGTRLLADSISVALHAREQKLFEKADWTALKAALQKEIMDWESAYSRELTRYRPDEAGFDECHGALQALPRLRQRLNNLD